MIAWFKNWYYGEDGMKPIYRTRRFHKVLIALLVACTYFSFCVLELDGVPLKIMGSAGFFAAVLCLWTLPELIFGENSGLAFFLNGGLTGCVILIACLAIGLIVGLVVTPLYLLLLVADLRYRAKVRRSNPEMLRKGRPVHRDLTK